MHATAFDRQSVERNAIGAGVIPFSRRPDGRICLLLAREQSVHNWRGAGKWSGFEGGRKNGECVLETAVREWSEESLGIMDHVGRTVEGNDHVCRLTLNIITCPPRPLSQERYHVTFLVYVPFDSECCETFARRRDALLHVQQLTATLRERLRESGVVTVVDIPRSATVPTDAVVTRSCDVPHTWWDAYTRLESYVAGATLEMADAIRIRYGPSGRLIDARVNIDYLEKDQVAWWDSTVLERMLRNGGRTETNAQFRVYFLPVLCSLLAFLNSV